MVTFSVPVNDRETSFSFSVQEIEVLFAGSRPGQVEKHDQQIPPQSVGTPAFSPESTFPGSKKSPMSSFPACRKTL